MSGKREIACGVDVHNKFIVATILSSDGLKLQNRFETSLEDLWSCTLTIEKAS